MRKFYKNIKRKTISFLIILITNFLKYFPLRYHKLISLLLYFFLGKFRKTGLLNLQIAGMNKKILWRNFCFMAYGALRFIKLNNESKEKILKNIRVKNFEIFEEKFKKNKGVLALTLHMGFWEVIPVYFSLKGYPVCVLASKVYTDIIDNYINKVRKKFGTKVVHPEKVVSLIKKIKKGYAIGILMDQRQGAKRAKVRFFNKEVEAPSGPIEIAYKTGAEVILIKTVEDTEFDLIHIESFVLKNNIKEDIQRIYSRFEKWIRERPEQWVWIHRRFF